MPTYTPIPLFGSVGSLFNRWGAIGQMLATTLQFQLQLETNMIDTTTGVVAQYNAESDLQAEIGNSYLGILSSLEGSAGVAQQLSQDTANRMVFRSNALINQTLTQSNTLASIDEIIRQMNLAGATILRMTVTAVPQTFPSGNQFANPEVTITPGNPIIVMSVNRPLDGLPLENLFGEILTVTCTGDSFTGGVQPFNESYSLTGQGSQTDLFAFNWPLGSNCSIGLSAINGQSNNGQGNLLTNSNWQTFTGSPSLPKNWTVTTGSSLISQSTSIVFVGTTALEILGDGATKLQIAQQFGSSSTGTPSSLSPQTQYAFNTWARRGGSAVTGILQISLVDQNGAVINDNNSVPNTISYNLAGLTTSWQAINGVFRLPTVLPSKIFLQYLTSTAVSAAGQVYLGDGALGLMTQCYTSGPFACLFSGNQPAVQNDYGYVYTTNSRGAGGTLATFQTLLARLLDPFVYSNEILFPSSFSPNILDTLI